MVTKLVSPLLLVARVTGVTAINTRQLVVAPFGIVQMLGFKFQMAANVLSAALVMGDVLGAVSQAFAFQADQLASMFYVVSPHCAIELRKGQLLLACITRLLFFASIACMTVHAPSLEVSVVSDFKLASCTCLTASDAAPDGHIIFTVPALEFLWVF